LTKRIAIIDYGMGNLYSVRNTFASLGIKADILADPSNLMDYDKLILPGVGAFGDAMKELNSRGFIYPIKEFIAQNRPFLGICLGMQLLMDASCESKGIKGLGVISGSVKKFSSKLKCPHMGWNEIEKVSDKSGIFKGLKGAIYTYFCHSYFVLPKDKKTAIGKTKYGITFASVLKQGKIYGMQFHPEKSQEVGLKLLQNFIKLS
jgi:imidazole glycerol-phosphate synthase subunit HisH